MKKINLILRTLAAICATSLFTSAVAQTSVNDASDQTNAPPEMVAPGPDEAPPDMSGGQPDASVPDDQQTSSTQTPPRVKSHGTAPVATENQTSSANGQTVFAPPTEATGTNPDELRLNFQNVPLEMVLNYLSDAAGFIIVMDTQVQGTVSVISHSPMTRDEAVDLLNSVLNQNGYAAIRNGRTLTILDKNDAKTRDIPVKVSNNPDSIPKNDEIVTQIIPVQFVEAGQLVTDLSSFVSPQATIVANEAGNSIVVTDTQANIRHLVEIIKAVDSSAEGETEIRVFRLQYASPDDVASELGQIFPSGNNSNGAQTPIRFGGGGGGGGPGGFFARMMAANGGGNNNSQTTRAQKQSQVVAVADPRTQSVIVTASKDLMEQISGMMEQLDVPSARDQKVYVFHVNNADPYQAVQVLQNMFQTSGTSRSGSSSSSSQNSALMLREQNNASTTSSSSSTTSSSFTGGATRTGGGGGQY
jgi:general secretion pathway protein D